MKMLNEKNCFDSECYSCLLVLPAIVILIGFLVCMTLPTNSYAQISSLSPFALNETSTFHAESSQRLSPPLFPPITQGQGTQLGLQQGQYSSFENPQLGYTVEYPANWQVRGVSGGNITTFSSPFEFNVDPFAANFVVGGENITGGNSLDSYTNSVVALLQSQPPAPGFNLTGGPVSTTLGGVPAHVLGFVARIPNERIPDTDIAGIEVMTLANDTAYVMSFASEQTKFSNYLPIIEHFFDTFRITRAT